MRSRYEVQRMSRSIVDSFGIPAVHVHVEVNPVEHIANFNVPFFAIPHCGPPPVARRAPRTARGCNRTMHAVKRNPDGCAVAKLDGGFQRWPESAQDDGLLPS